MLQAAIEQKLNQQNYMSLHFVREPSEPETGKQLIKI